MTFITADMYESGSERSLPMMMAVLPQPAEPMSIAAWRRASRLSSQKLIDAVSPVGTVTIDMGVFESYEIGRTESAQGMNSCFFRSM